MRYIIHTCAMEPVTYDLDIKLTCMVKYIVQSYIFIHANTLFKPFEMLELRYLIYKLYYLFCYMNK